MSDGEQDGGADNLGGLDFFAHGFLDEAALHAFEGFDLRFPAEIGRDDHPHPHFGHRGCSVFMPPRIMPPALLRESVTTRGDSSHAN